MRASANEYKKKKRPHPRSRRELLSRSDRSDLANAHKKEKKASSSSSSSSSSNRFPQNCPKCTVLPDHFSNSKNPTKKEREREKGAGTKTNARASPLTCIFLGRCIFFLSSFCRTTNDDDEGSHNGEFRKRWEKMEKYGDNLNISPSYTSPKGRFRTLFGGKNGKKLGASRKSFFLLP